MGSTTMVPMAEHVFESALVEEFYNSCHGPNGRFCSGGKGGKGKGAASATKGYGSGKTDPKALSVTQKYGTRGAGAGTKVAAPAGSASKKAGGTSGSKYKPDQYGSGKTNPDALKLTNKFGTRGARPAAKKKKDSNIKYGADKSGSGKTEPSALEITRRFGTRRG